MENVAGRRQPGDRIKVSMADYRVSSGGTLTTSGLGSCLGIALYDARAGVGALAHPMLPSRDGQTDRPPGRFVDSGIHVVVEGMIRHGARLHRIEAKIAGGATVLDFTAGDERSIGERNVETARRTLRVKGIEIAGEEVGGNCGRSMRVVVDTGDAVVERTDGVETTL